MTDKKRVMVYLSDSEFKQLQQLADLHQTSMSRVLSGCLLYFLRHNDYPGMTLDLRRRLWFKKN